MTELNFNNLFKYTERFSLDIWCNLGKLDKFNSKKNPNHSIDWINFYKSVGLKGASDSWATYWARICQEIRQSGGFFADADILEFAISTTFTNIKFKTVSSGYIYNLVTKELTDL